MDISSIAATTVAFLSPFLAKGGEELFKGAGKELWDFVKTKFSNERNNKTLHTYINNPSDPKNQGKIELKIEEMLEEDEEFLLKVHYLLKKISESEDFGHQSIIIQRHSGSGDNVGRDKII